MNESISFYISNKETTIRFWLFLNIINTYILSNYINKNNVKLKKSYFNILFKTTREHTYIVQKYNIQSILEELYLEYYIHTWIL